MFKTANPVEMLFGEKHLLYLGVRSISVITHNTVSAGLTKKTVLGEKFKIENIQDFFVFLLCANPQIKNINFF